MHPILYPIKVTWSSMLLNKLGLSCQENVVTNRCENPPFYVALSKGIFDEEEMITQHAYDFFGDFDAENISRTYNIA